LATSAPKELKRNLKALRVRCSNYWTTCTYTKQSYTPFTRWSWLDELARRALVERSWCARRAGLMSWLSGHLNGIILQTFTKLLVERSSSARRAGSTSARRASFIV